ncbi:MAG TPA: hypothetical protein VH054_16595 [Polyangiaceae bacterium]|nr:hypothetical protein [Polyangiaceae bacterium]
MRPSSMFVGAGVGLLVALGLSIPSARGDAKPPTIGVDEIKEGMKGYGLTVFHGYEPERFDVEVIGVLHNFRPAQDLILVKTPHPRLNITKNVQGMSGSPIYLDNGRLAGAYAYSLRTFMIEPVAGVTPIAPMLTELHRPVPPGFWPLEGQPPLPNGASTARHAMRSATQWEGAPGSYDLSEHAKALATRFSSGNAPSDSRIVSATTPMMVAGLGSNAIAALTPLLSPLGLEVLQAGGTQTGTQTGPIPDHFVDGGSLGVQMARGDVSMFGFGTVTKMEGTRLCGFGHPMMGAGDTALPAAIARVMWIYASEQHSFKVGEAAKSLGALVNDRQSAVIVDETKKAPSFPLHLEVRGVTGAPKTTWNVEIGEEKFMSAALAAAVVSSAIEATVSERRDISWTLRSRVSIHGHAPIDLEDFGIATGGMPETGDWLSSRVVRTVGEALNNPWDNIHVDGIQATLEIRYMHDVYRLRGVDLLDPIVDAGEKARVVLHLRPFSGAEVTRSAEIAIPPELAGRDVEIEIVPGYEIVPDVAPPENLDQLLANATRSTLRPQSIVLQIKMPTQGVVFAGHVAPRLPSFALDALRPTTSDVAPEVIASYVRSVVPVDQYVDGRDKVKIKVRAKLR